MATVGQLADSVVRWWERDDVQDVFDALTAAIDTDSWGAHDLCSLTACRAPLHPGPCKGWKHTLHLVSPGAFKALEQERVDRLNRKRLAKVADLKSKGLRVPPALLKPIMPRDNPGTPPPGWTPGHLAPNQPAANAVANVDRVVSKVGKTAAQAKGPAHVAAQAGTAPHVPAQRTPVPSAAPAAHAAPSAPAPGKVVHAVATTTAPEYNANQRVAANLSRYRGALTPNQVGYLEKLSDADYKGLDNAHKVDLHGRLRAERGPERARAQALANKFDRLDGKSKPAPAASAPAPSAPAVPAQRTSVAAQHAAKMSTGGTAKAKLAAYQGLSKGDFEGLPDDTKTKIARDLTLMHGKFLDPAKKKAVADVQAKLGTDAHIKSVGTPSGPQVGTTATAPVKAVAPSVPSAPAAKRRLDHLAGITKADFDKRGPVDRAAVLQTLDVLSKPGSGLDDADRKRAADLHTALRTPAAPAKLDAAAQAVKDAKDAVNAVNAKGYPDKVKEVAQQAHGGNDLDHLNALGELTRADLGKLDATDNAQVAKRLVESEKSADPLVADTAKALHDVLATHVDTEPKDASLIDLAEGRIKVADAMAEKDPAKFLAAAGDLTQNHTSSVDRATRTALHGRLGAMSTDHSLDQATREHALRLYHATGMLPPGGTGAHTHTQLADLRAQQLRDKVKAAITGTASGDMKRQLDNAYTRAYDEGHATALAQHMVDLAKDTSLEPRRRAALAFRALALDSKVPSSVRIALDMAHDIPANQPTSTALARYITADLNNPGTPAHVPDIINAAMNDFIDHRLLAMPDQAKDQNLSDLLDQWDTHNLAKRLDNQAKDAIRATARERIDSVLNPTSGITTYDHAAAIRAQELLDKVDGKATTLPPKVQMLLDDITSHAATGGRGGKGIDPLPAARDLTSADYRNMPPLVRKLLDDYLNNAMQVQALLPQTQFSPIAPRSTTAAYELARLRDELPSYQVAHKNRAVATARFDAEFHTPDEALRDLQLLDAGDYRSLTAPDRKAVDDALARLANPPAAMQPPPDLHVRYEAQGQLDELKGFTYSYDAERAITAADPTRNADPSLLSALGKVDKAEYDKLPPAFRDAIDAKLTRLAAGGDRSATALVAKYHPSPTPLGVGSPGPGVTGLPAPITTSSNPKVQAALDTIYGVHPQAHTAAHQIKTYGALTAGDFSQLNGPEQQQVLGDLSYVATTSKGTNKLKAQGFITRFTAAGTPAGQVGPQAIYPPAGSVTGQTRLPVPQAGLLVQSPNPGHGGDGFITLSNGKRVWGKYGAAGVLLAHDGPDGKRRYLMVQRGPGISDPGKWHYPGGAIDSNETAYQGGTREVLEELGFDPKDFAAAKVHGYHEAAQPGWKYTSVVATVDKQLVPNLKGASHGGETADAKWLTIEEIRDLDKNGRLLAPLAGGAFEQNVASILPPKGSPTIAQVAAVTKKLPRLTPSGTRKTAGKVVRGKDMLAADPTGKHAALRAQVNADKTKYDGKTADGRLAALAAAQGYDALPTVLPKADIDKLIATGDYWVVYRGVKDGGGKTAKQINDDLRYGDAYFGKGIFGNGYYFSTVERTARQYAAGYYGSGGSIVRALIPKDIKTAEGSKKVTEARGYYGTSRVLQDAGRLGIAQGLDALILTDSQASHLGASKSTPSFNILNRAILIVQAEDHK